ncbi:MAG: shikimate dehydrogenase [Flavobacteriales bacterium]
MKIYGLVGKNIAYAHSRNYFSAKFKREKIAGASYRNFDIPTIGEIRKIWLTPNLAGLNITIPYKEKVTPYLDDLSPEAMRIGAVNTIQFLKDKKIGHNTDAYGFEKSLIPLLKDVHTHALILGTGGASKAVTSVLKKLGIQYRCVSRTRRKNALTYEELCAKTILTHRLVVNCTPMGAYPDIDKAPDIPYEFLSPNHLVYDLIYNPDITAFMKRARAWGAQTTNGYQMLVLQAEKAWEIWNH